MGSAVSRWGTGSCDVFWLGGRARAVGRLVMARNGSPGTGVVRAQREVRGGTTGGRRAAILLRIELIHVDGFIVGRGGAGTRGSARTLAGGWGQVRRRRRRRKLDLWVEVLGVGSA